MRITTLLHWTCVLFGFSISLLTADWPTYRGDYSRSGIGGDALPPQVREAWKWTSRHRPQPAWQGEAKWDGWNKVYNLKPRQIFDRAFHTVANSKRVYFGSSADDKVYCLDFGTGAEVWSFYTEGPVRLAPSLDEKYVYFGSDDGNVYCLDNQTGKQIWKTRLSLEEKRIPGNGRVISAWPVRSSVVVMDGKVYATAGMFPKEGVHLVSLEASTGKIIWRQTQNDLPAQGYLLASSTRLYIPAGRDNPVVCNIADGKRLQVLEGAGGTYALLTGDMLVFGPGKTGQLGAVEDGRKDQLATFQGNHMIVTPNRSFLHSDTEITALDRARYLELSRDKKRFQATQSQLNKRLKAMVKEKDKDQALVAIKEELREVGRKIDEVSDAMGNCNVWTVKSEWPHSIVLSGQTLVVGGENSIAALDAYRGTVRWKETVNGNAYGLAVANGSLLVSTDEGIIHCFKEPKQVAARTQNTGGQP